MFESLLNPVMNPLLRLPPFLAILLISFLIALTITLVYKMMTDQKLMKILKDDLKKLQKEMKEFKDHPQKVMALQKQAMEKNMKYMSHSMKPTLITMLPIIIIFGWLNAHMGYHQIMPGQDFTTTVTFKPGTYGNITITVPEAIQVVGDSTVQITGDQAMWTLNGAEGQYLIQYDYLGRRYEKEVLITPEREYKTPVIKVKDSNIKGISIDNEKVIALNIFGWKLGWLGTYILCSLIFSMSLRKLLKIH